jgi:hypothetical protein
MTDLERLFRRLVDNLIAIDPARLHRPVGLGDLLDSVIPYRTNRRALGVDSAEDYDMLVLRLCAGEGGFVRLLDDGVAQRFRDEAASPNPDLTVLRSHPQAELILETEPLAHALGPGPEEVYAPPEEELLEFPGPAPQREPAPPPEVSLDHLRLTPTTVAPEVASAPMMPPPPRITPEPDPEPPLSTHRRSGPRCGYCGGRLPTGRTVNFCPHCGQNQSFTRCPECQAELEFGWKHCINCGHFIGE